MALPEVFLEPIKTFLTLHDEERSKFVESVLQTAPSIKLDAFSHRVAQAAKMEPDLVKKILSVLAGLYMAIQDGRTSIGAIANQIRVALTASELAPADGNWELFMSDFERLLTAPNPFTTTAKALELFIEHPKAFASCRILTDLRPVFAADPATGPTAFMVFHSFVLGYREDNEDHEVFLALDSNDIDLLRSALERAAAKEKSLTEYCKTRSVPVFGLQ